MLDDGVDWWYQPISCKDFHCFQDHIMTTEQELGIYVDLFSIQNENYFQEYFSIFMVISTWTEQSNNQEDDDIILLNVQHKS